MMVPKPLNGTIQVSLVFLVDPVGGTYVYEGIYSEYWTTLNQYVGTINGSIYSSYLADFNSKINETQPYYKMFSITESWGKPYWVPSWQCFDFVFASMKFLQGDVS
jgi:hypothetical protein